jgi:hypothetical protein
MRITHFSGSTIVLWRKTAPSTPTNAIGASLPMKTLFSMVRFLAS